MPGPAINTPSRARFQRLLDERLKLAGPNRAEIITRKAKSVAVRLYTETKKVAPSDVKIKQDVLALGWRVRRKAGPWPLKKGEKRGSTGPLNRMRAGQIARRQKARGYVATGWLPAVRRLAGRQGGKRLVEVKNPRGRVTITESAGTTTIMIANSTPGVVKVEAQHGILRAALNAESKDIIKYIRQKLSTGSGKGVGGNG